MRVRQVVLLLAVIVSLTSALEFKYNNKTKVLKPQMRITNGQPAAEGQFKYQVLLYIEKEQVTTWCGGSLISPDWILTAAHCIEGANKVNAFMGSTGYLSGQLVSVMHAIFHADWDRVTSANDICLLRIPTIKLGANIEPVALPPHTDSTNSYINKTVIASGWGATSDQNGNPPDRLQYARLTVKPNQLCSQYYEFSVIIFRDSTNICVQGPRGTSECRGDSGGPLVTESGVLVGITSFGASAGCTLGHPGAYTRVSSYRSWIYNITGV